MPAAAAADSREFFSTFQRGTYRKAGGDDSLAVFAVVFARRQAITLSPRGGEPSQTLVSTLEGASEQHLERP
jgi:hypothetical protein